MTEPTPEQQQQVCAELARAMGWREPVQYESSFWYSPEGERKYGVPPNPFISAADSRALLCWLAADRERWRRFFNQLSHALELDFDVEYPVWCALLLMTAPLAIIATAAHSAITEAQQDDR